MIRIRPSLVTALLIAAAVIAAPAPAQTGGGAPYSIDGRGFSRLQDAVDAIGEGQGTISIAPGYHRDCAVQTAGRIAFVAAEERKNPSRGLVIEGNRATLPAGMDRKSVFVADWSGEALAIGQNELGAGLTRFEKRSN